MASPEGPAQPGAGLAGWLAAADQALARDDYAGARGHASEVLRLTTARPGAPEHAHARLRLARCDFAVGRIERALAAATQAAAAFRKQEQHADEVAALALASRAATRAGRVVEAVETGLLALSLAQALPPGPAAAQAACALGAAYAAGHHFASAERALRSATDLAQRCADAHGLVDATIEATLARLVRHALARIDGEADPQPLLEALERCRELEVVGGTGPAQARALASTIALAACLTDDVDDARRHLVVHAEPLRAGIAPHWSGALDAWTRLELAWLTHEAHDAVMHAAQIAAVAEAAQHAPLRCLGHVLAADLHESRGDAASALIEWKAALRHDRANRQRDIDGRLAAADALVTARRNEIDVAMFAAQAAQSRGAAEAEPGAGFADARRFEHALADALVAGADAGEPVCVAFLACDGLDAIDAELGRAAGDAMLAALADAIRQGVRAADVAARLDGRRFAVLFRNAPLAVAREACERIAAAVARHEALGLPAGLAIAVEAAQPGDTPGSLAERGRHVRR